MFHPDGPGNTQLNISALDQAYRAVVSSQRQLLEHIARCELDKVWEDDGAIDMAQWLSARLHISNWAARRWIVAAQALKYLPRTAAALENGDLSLDKVVELARFAEPATERKLISWARRVSVASVRHRAALANRPPLEEVVNADRTRYLRHWFYDDGARMALAGDFPADQGTAIAKALDRLATDVPVDPELCDPDDLNLPPYVDTADQRRADALHEMAMATIAQDQDPDRATVVVHAPLAALLGDQGTCELAGGPVIHPATALRLCCDARLQTVLEDGEGYAVGVGHMYRTAPPWIMRLLRQRDRECLFPGCQHRRFLHAHHIVHWIHGGPTDLINLALVCPVHHKLVHEYGWRIELGAPGTARWFRPNGTPYGPDP